MPPAHRVGEQLLSRAQSCTTRSTARGRAPLAQLSGRLVRRTCADARPQCGDAERPALGDLRCQFRDLRERTAARLSSVGDSRAQIAEILPTAVTPS